MQLKVINSSMISKVGYDTESQTLRVAFLSTGQLVDYFHVPEYIYHGIIEAKSPGTYMNNFVINCFEYKNIKAEKK
jgi:KTSC domain